MSDEEKLKDCDCEYWQEGIDEINRFIELGLSHRMYYTAAFFKFCPWCGKQREVDE